MSKQKSVAKNKTTKQQFKVFKDECKKWIERFGLKGWRVEYCHEETDSNDRANITYYTSGRSAVINLSAVWGKNRTASISDSIIKQAAFHEVCELLLARLEMMAKEEIGNSKYAIEEEVHNLIRILENTVWKEGEEN